MNDEQRTATKTAEDALRSALRRTSKGNDATAVRAALALALWDDVEVPARVVAVIRSMGSASDVAVNSAK